MASWYLKTSADVLKKQFPAFLTINSPGIPKQSFEIVLHERPERVDQSNSVHWDLLKSDLKIKATGEILSLQQWKGSFSGAWRASLVGRVPSMHQA